MDWVCCVFTCICPGLSVFMSLIRRVILSKNRLEWDARDTSATTTPFFNYSNVSLIYRLITTPLDVILPRFYFVISF